MHLYGSILCALHFFYALQLHGIHIRVPRYLPRFSRPRNSSPTIFAEVFEAPEFESHDVCEVFDGCPRSARRPCSVLLLYRDGFGEGGCPKSPRRPYSVTFVLQRRIFESLKALDSTTFVLERRILRGGRSSKRAPALYSATFVLQRTFSVKKNTKNTKTRGFWHLYHAETLRGVAFVCQKHAKTRGFWHRDQAETRRGLTRARKNLRKPRVFAPRPRRNPQRVVRAWQETLKKEGCSTATMPKPAEGCPRTARNVKSEGFSTATTLKPAEGCPRTARNANKTRVFSTATTPKPAEGCPRTARNAKKTRVLAPRPRRNPQRVAIPDR